MHLQPVFRDCPAYLNGVSESLFERGLCLPSSSIMTDEEREKVVEAMTDWVALELDKRVTIKG